MKSLRIKSKFWIEDETGRPVFGTGKKDILEKIHQLGSIRAAAQDLKMSYRAVWGKIKTAEERLGLKLIQPVAGGGRDRGTILTPEALDLLNLFQTIHEQGNKQADALFGAVFANWRFRDITDISPPPPER